MTFKNYEGKDICTQINKPDINVNFQFIMVTSGKSFIKYNNKFYIECYTDMMYGYCKQCSIHKLSRMYECNLFIANNQICPVQRHASYFIESDGI